MCRFLPVIAAIVLPFFAAAQEPSPAPTVSADDLHTLRQLVEQQSKQIEMLSQQVVHLTQLLESNHPGASASTTPATTQNMPPTQESDTAPAPTPLTKEDMPPAPPGGAQHVVAKGETLISIAKYYKISVAELLKVNKIQDERKLQIGQTLTIPSAKPTDPSKKNNL
ncbi:MAG: LysM domain [Chthoniobacter sp.]|jgi:LysM repeat protein|nr:LysM domain [Chthoniobacter sp.]